MSRLSRILSMLLTALALLVLISGSFLSLGILLGIGFATSNYPDYALSADTLIMIYWPFVALMVWLFGSAALLTIGRRKDTLPLFGYCVLIAFGPVLAVAKLGGYVPVRGQTAVILILLFVILDAIGVFFALQFLLRRDWPNHTL